jgi:hypothetical protein
MLFRLLKRRQAIKSFVFKLPLELRRRFGAKTHYSVEEIDRVLESGKFNRAFSAYAYAMLCSRATFEDYFRGLNVDCTYDGLRKIVADRYLNGAIDFDAASLVRFAKDMGGAYYYESGAAGGDVNVSGGSHGGH